MRLTMPKKIIFAETTPIPCDFLGIEAKNLRGILWRNIPFAGRCRFCTCVWLSAHPYQTLCVQAVSLSNKAKAALLQG